MTIQVEHQSYIYSIYQLSDNDELILSNDLAEDELEILHNYLIEIKENLESNLKKPIIINQLAEKYDISYNAAEMDIREIFNKRIEMVLADLAVIDEWCKENDLPIPGSQEAIDSKKQHQRLSDKTIKQHDKEKAKREKQKYPLLRKKDAVCLLKKLEDENYVRTKEDDRIINHPRFKIYRAQHTEKKQAYFDSIAKKILKLKVISQNEFCEICKCPNSDYYKKYYMRSFLDFCAKKGGEYKNIIEGERYINETPEKEITLRIKK